MIKSFKAQFGKKIVLGKKGGKTKSKPYEQNMDIEANSRLLHVKVKKKSGTIKNSSRLWLQRQLNDVYVVQAKKEGYRSRASYKLLQINEKYNFLKKGQKIVDLGAAPGGWSQIAVKLTSSNAEHPNIVAIDYLPMQPLEGVILLQMDFLHPQCQGKIIELLKGKPDVILSDMAAPTTGNRRTDHYRTTHLCEVAVDFAIESLNIGGVLLTKTFQGGAEADIRNKLTKYFTKVAHVKPPSSRPESVELYLIALGFKGKS